jgi:hypothetical protein
LALTRNIRPIASRERCRDWRIFCGLILMSRTAFISVAIRGSRMSSHYSRQCLDICPDKKLDLMQPAFRLTGRKTAQGTARRSCCLGGSWRGCTSIPGHPPAPRDSSSPATARSCGVLSPCRATAMLGEPLCALYHVALEVLPTYGGASSPRSRVSKLKPSKNPFKTKQGFSFDFRLLTWADSPPGALTSS